MGPKPLTSKLSFRSTTLRPPLPDCGNCFIDISERSTVWLFNRFWASASIDHFTLVVHWWPFKTRRTSCTISFLLVLYTFLSFIIAQNDLSSRTLDAMRFAHSLYASVSHLNAAVQTTLIKSIFSCLVLHISEGFERRDPRENARNPMWTPVDFARWKISISNG